jgi:hypothetical protein
MDNNIMEYKLMSEILEFEQEISMKQKQINSRIKMLQQGSKGHHLSLEEQ